MDEKELYRQARAAAEEIMEKAKLHRGQLLVVGCSTSEILGDKIGSHSSPETAKAVFGGIYDATREKGIYLAAQCCEHLNRSLVIERAAADAYRLDEVNAVPQMHAGGSFGTVTYERMEDPVLVESVRAVAGMDIGGTLIGMHMKPVAVPVRVSIDHIGEAILILARSRAKFIGGERAHYNEDLK